METDRRSGERVKRPIWRSSGEETPAYRPLASMSTAVSLANCEKQHGITNWRPLPLYPTAAGTNLGCEGPSKHIQDRHQVGAYATHFRTSPIPVWARGSPASTAPPCDSGCLGRGMLRCLGRTWLGLHVSGGGMLYRLAWRRV